MRFVVFMFVLLSIAFAQDKLVRDFHNIIFIKKDGKGCLSFVREKVLIKAWLGVYLHPTKEQARLICKKMLEYAKKHRATPPRELKLKVTNRSEDSRLYEVTYRYPKGDWVTHNVVKKVGKRWYILIP